MEPSGIPPSPPAGQTGGAGQSSAPSQAARNSDQQISQNQAAQNSQSQQQTAPQSGTQSSQTPQAPAQTQATPSQPLPSASLPDAAKAVLQGGQPLGGTVTASSASPPQITVQTPSGNINIPTGQPLPPGTNILLQLAPGSQIGDGSVRLLITLPQASGGQTAGTTAQSGQIATAQGSGAQQAVLTTLTQGSTVSATVVSTAQAGNIAPGATPPSGVSQGDIAQGGMAQGGTAQSGMSAGGQLPQGTTLNVRIATLILPGEGSAAPSGQQAGPAMEAGAGQIAGTVVGNAGKSAILVQTNLGLLKIPARSSPPDGTRLLLEPLGQPQLPAQPPASAAAQDQLQWNSLKEALAALNVSNPALAGRIMQALIPQPNNQMGATMLFFMSALKGGSVDGWLGQDALRALERLSAGSTRRLDGGFKAREGRARDSTGNDWKMVQIPVSADGDLDMAKLYYRDNPDKDEDTEGKRETGKRFVVEVNFTRLGPFQFDGIYKNGDKHLDLMIRTNEALDKDMREGIRALFAHVVETMGLKGRIDFHVTARFDIQPVTPSGALPSGVVI